MYIYIYIYIHHVSKRGIPGGFMKYIIYIFFRCASVVWGTSSCNPEGYGYKINWYQITIKRRPGAWFNRKMSSYQYRKSHCGDKTILRPSYLHNGISYTGKMTSLYWIMAQVHSSRDALYLWNNINAIILDITPRNSLIVKITSYEYLIHVDFFHYFNQH